MSFHDDRQAARACQALCARIRKGVFWTSDPPQATQLAIEVLEGRDSYSHGERVIVLVAWALWNGDRTVPFAEVVNTLSRDHLEAVLTLVSAVDAGGAAVERWLRMNEVRPVVAVQSGWATATSRK